MIIYLIEELACQFYFILLAFLYFIVYSFALIFCVTPSATVIPDIFTYFFLFTTKINPLGASPGCVAPARGSRAWSSHFRGDLTP